MTSRPRLLVMAVIESSLLAESSEYPENPICDKLDCTHPGFHTIGIWINSAPFMEDSGPADREWSVCAIHLGDLMVTSADNMNKIMTGDLND